MSAPRTKPEFPPNITVRDGGFGSVAPLAPLLAALLLLMVVCT